MEGNKRLTRLSQDIKQIFINAHGKEIEMIRLCRDHRDPLLHSDRKPVLGITQDDFVGIFNTNSNHFFLSADEICRLGTYCGLKLPNLIALMLKAEWEIHLFRIASQQLIKGSGSPDPECHEEGFSTFRPDVRMIYKKIRSLSDDSGIDYDQIDFLTRDLLNQKSFLVENNLIGKAYSDMDITEEVLLTNCIPDEKEKYLRLKELWKVRTSELDTLLLNLERKKRLNLETENKYFRTFGKQEFERAKQRLRFRKYSIIVDIMQGQPGLSFRELLRLTSDRLTDDERNRNELRNKIIRSRNRIEVLAGNISKSPVTKEFEVSYMQECRKMLRKLYLLLHTDTCPNYAGLSENKKVEINKLWLDLMKSTKNEIFSFSPNMLLYSLPDLDALRSVYNRACEIIGIDPECFETGNRLEFMIRKGIPISRIIEFLKSETEQIELHLAHLELIQEEYTNEDQTQKYMDGLENIKDHTDKLSAEIDAIKEKILNIKKLIREKLTKTAG